MNRHKLFLISAVICLMLLVYGTAGIAKSCIPCNPVNTSECGFTQGSVKVTVDGLRYSSSSPVVICVGKTVFFKIKGYSDVDWCDDPEPIADEPLQYCWELDGVKQLSGDNNSWSCAFGGPGEYVVGWFVKDPGNKADDPPNPCEDSEQEGWDYCGEISVIAVEVASISGPKELYEDQNGMFSATTNPSGHEDILTWEAPDGNPSSGGGGSFTTSWSNAGAHLVTVECGTSSMSKVVNVTSSELECEGMPCGGDGGGDGGGGFSGGGFSGGGPGSPGGPGGGGGYG